MLRGIAVAAVLLASSAALGRSEPVLIRPVVLGGVSGTGYYSVVENGFRLIGGLPSRIAERTDGVEAAQVSGDLALRSPKPQATSAPRIASE